MLRRIAVVLQPPVAAFEFGTLVEVFGIDRSDDGVPRFDFRVCAEHPGTPLTVGHGAAITAADPLSAADTADLIALPSSPVTEPPSAAVLDVIRRAEQRGAYVLSVCTGAYALAAAGVLDGRTVATHWRYAHDLARRYPRVHVEPSILYAQDGVVVSSAGTAAGIDACLHLVRSEHGTAIANRIARRMVVAPHRQGGQKQFIERPALRHADPTLQPLLDWITDNLQQPLTVEDMAARAGMSTRTLTRRFSAEIGDSPHGWVTRQRVARAQELLEETRLTVENVAAETGFGSAPLLRHHFVRTLGITPTVYRRQFAVAGS
ncbi:GlxA family transcriptional regulator [Pseudonocardia sp. CA-107938]|uniref:GlxA family transcriptional regulator n=1 Tax=Pseudonocardia sp. CA-107938 TaxID=3240021 RepID=UPI003D8B2C22